ncbi:hypothetical protein C7212DRAFT_342468 [Tuber magnatum]|uniref:Uncharacterized protein n=1 Tax=Tuber magnatum TaxID=42249 RepID=A0A317STT6_9PEZI|nr:hypothetical protein C7212DRAFT_342468 [Tuber magnatum]
MSSASLFAHAWSFMLCPISSPHRTTTDSPFSSPAQPHPDPTSININGLKTPAGLIVRAAFLGGFTDWASGRFTPAGYSAAVCDLVSGSQPHGYCHDCAVAIFAYAPLHLNNPMPREGSSATVREV